MKTILFIAVMLSSVFFSFGQKISEKEVPAAVRQSFQKQFNGIKATSWTKEETVFEAKFTRDGIVQEAAFREDGLWLETEHDVRQKDLPEAVMKSLKAGSYGTWKVEEAVAIESPEYPHAFEIEVSLGKQKASLYFTPDGRLVKEEKD